MIQSFSDSRHARRDLAVNLKLNLHPVVDGQGAALAKRLADLLERPLLGHVLGEAVRSHLYAR